MEPTIGDTPDLELALLRRGLDGRIASSEECAGCERSLLIGERVYVYEDGALRCSLCRRRSHQHPLDSHTVHGPAFGHSIRVLDRRPLRHAA